MTESNSEFDNWSQDQAAMDQIDTEAGFAPPYNEHVEYKGEPEHIHDDDGTVEGCPGCFADLSDKPPYVRPEDGVKNVHRQIARYADQAMFTATPMVEQGEEIKPRVTLLHMTDNPLRLIAAVYEMYKGNPVHDPSEITQDLALETFRGLAKSKIQAAYEWVDFAFLIEGVSRAFMDQLRTQRTAVFAAESLRFAVKEDFPMVMPPSIAELAEDDPKRVVWKNTAARLAWGYQSLIQSGIPAEDARSILPMNIATRIHYKTNLRNFIQHAGMRLCSQAQNEWKIVWREFHRAILRYGPPTERWQQMEIGRLFKPVCFETGKCEFMAPTDRYCVIRDRVQAHYEAGDKPNVWTDINPLEPLHHLAARKPQ